MLAVYLQPWHQPKSKECSLKPHSLPNCNHVRFPLIPPSWPLFQTIHHPLYGSLPKSWTSNGNSTPKSASLFTPQPFYECWKATSLVLFIFWREEIKMAIVRRGRYSLEPIQCVKYKLDLQVDMLLTRKYQIVFFFPFSLEIWREREIEKRSCFISVQFNLV